jgi:hypothetical protein
MRKGNRKQFYRLHWCRCRLEPVSRTINFKSNIHAEFYRRRSSDFIRVLCKQARFTEIKPYFIIKTPRRGSYYILHKMRPRENSLACPRQRRQPRTVRGGGGDGGGGRRARADPANHRSRVLEHLHRRSQKTSRHMHAGANLGVPGSPSLIIGELAPHRWSSQMRKVGERWLSGDRWHFLHRIWCPALPIEPPSVGVARERQRFFWDQNNAGSFLGPHV